MKRLLFVSLVSGALLSAATCLQAADNTASTNKVAVAAGKPQTTCPVTGEALPAKPDYVDVEGKRIYVCCAGCNAKIKKDPKKYIQQMEAAGVTLENAPAKPAAK